MYSISFSINFSRFGKKMELIKQYSATTEEDTKSIALDLSARFQVNDIVLLEGDLGSGKTFLVKALCEIWQTTDEAASPTFAILHQYRGKMPVNHFDLYRIETVDELDNLGWEEFLEMDAVTFIEWPQILEAQLDEYYKIKINMQGVKREFELYRSN